MIRSLLLPFWSGITFNFVIFITYVRPKKQHEHRNFFFYSMYGRKVSRHWFRAVYVCQGVTLRPVFRIRIGLNTDPDPAFEVSTDPDPAFKVNTDPDPGFFMTTFYQIFLVNSQLSLFIPLLRTLEFKSKNANHHKDYERSLKTEI